ncbi:MAG: DUF5793 family protein, partial [Halanaeroarchaeum sp.]
MSANDPGRRYVLGAWILTPVQEMRRDYFTLEVENVDWVETDDEPAKPSVTIDFDVPGNTLRERLMNVDDEPLAA